MAECEQRQRHPGRIHVCVTGIGAWWIRVVGVSAQFVGVEGGSGSVGIGGDSLATRIRNDMVRCTIPVMPTVTTSSPRSPTPCAPVIRSRD